MGKRPVKIHETEQENHNKNGEDKGLDKSGNG